MTKNKPKREIKHYMPDEKAYEDLRLAVVEERRKQQLDFIIRNNLNRKKYQ